MGCREQTTLELLQALLCVWIISLLKLQSSTGSAGVATGGHAPMKSEMSTRVYNAAANAIFNACFSEAFIGSRWGNNRVTYGSLPRSGRCLRDGVKMSRESWSCIHQGGDCLLIMRNKWREMMLTQVTGEFSPGSVRRIAAPNSRSSRVFPEK